MCLFEDIIAAFSERGNNYKVIFSADVGTFY